MNYMKFLFAVSGMFLLLNGCTTTPTIPENTTLSFNFVKTTPGRTGKLVIMDGQGNILDFKKFKEYLDKKENSGNKHSRKRISLPPTAKQKGALSLRFYKVNPCYTEVCTPGFPCEIVETEGDCTVVTDPTGGSGEPEPDYITCKKESGGLCLDTTIEATSCPLNLTEGACP